MGRELFCISQNVCFIATKAESSLSLFSRHVFRTIKLMSVVKLLEIKSRVLFSWQPIVSWLLHFTKWNKVEENGFVLFLRKKLSLYTCQARFVSKHSKVFSRCHRSSIITSHISFSWIFKPTSKKRRFLYSTVDNYFNYAKPTDTVKLFPDGS